MQKLILIFIVSFVCMACRPEPRVEDMQASQLQLVKESEKMQTKEHTAEVRLTVPDSTWSIKIVNVTQTEGELAIVCQLTQSDMMGLMVISEVVDAVKFTAKDLPIKYYIKGKKWNWENQEDYTFMDDESNFHIRNGEPIVFEVTEPTSKSGPKKQPIGTPL